MISYFLPHKNGSNQNHLVEAGLEMLLRPGDDSPKFADLPGPGPGDLPGQIVSWGSSECLAYLPEQQTWTPAPPDPKREQPAERYWIGRPKGQLPGPKDLARKADSTYDGIPMRLGDGNNWVMPNALRFPHYLGYDESGHYDRFPANECRSLYDRTLWALDHAQQVMRNETEFDDQRTFEYVIEMLAINYRICPQLVSMLQLFNDANLFRAMCNTTDVDQLFSIQEDLKKNSSV
ncbi:hypothetical protein Enr10x_21070 [Gimesia panareensis]|uniref:Uncharacterized protein n=1 Tax=Gimesia panareensis TaxID=2527978 RepID=A0A517Q5B1_9PLAN|nr:hypothetical protein [Gimesia panareensis]QDT26797.1 hypothetical protein Enr10x_21070 [Gimesia panareensis]